MGESDADQRLLSPSSSQVAFVLVFGVSLALWFYSEFIDTFRKKQVHAHDDAEHAETGQAKQEAVKSDQAASAAGNQDSNDLAVEQSVWPTFDELKSNSFTRCILLDQEAIRSSRDILRSVVEFCSIMSWFYCADRTNLVGSVEKVASLRDLSIVFLALTVTAFLCSMKSSTRGAVLLNRPQTEEWKGWMQVLFLLYHYYVATSIYNAIRVFIAGYVWMTGFGNFTYYYKTNDFSLTRFCAMMWRLNFMVAVVCVVLRNSYMLYYICPMHTLFTVMVYVALWIGKDYNKNSFVIPIKFLACFAVVYLLWDIKPVFYAVWKPFTWLVAYQDPRRPGEDPLREWYFRSSLDRYVWIYGMMCAYVHPRVEGFLKYIDDMPSTPRMGVRFTIVIVTTLIGYLWYALIYLLPKLEYNAWHPFTSWIPLTVWMVLRNLTPGLRTTALSLYGWLGCITLETYIGQFHTWLKTEIPDGQPKALLGLLPFDYTINFIACTALYIFLSYRVFLLTNNLKVAAIPDHCNRKLLLNVLLMTAGVTAALGVGWLVTAFT